MSATTVIRCAGLPCVRCDSEGGFAPPCLRSNDDARFDRLPRKGKLRFGFGPEAPSGPLLLRCNMAEIEVEIGEKLRFT